MAKGIIFFYSWSFLICLFFNFHSLLWTRIRIKYRYLPLLYWNVSLDGRLFTTLILFSESFSSQFNLKMEDRMADVVEEMVPADMVAVSGGC